MKLTAGTKVYLKEGLYVEHPCNPLRIVGEVEEPSAGYVDVLWHNGKSNCYLLSDLIVCEGIPNAFWKGM